MKKSRVGTRKGLRIRNFSDYEKLLAVSRVLAGEPRPSVGRDMKIPESTLRGWIKTPSIVAAAEQFDAHTAADMTTPGTQMVAEHWSTNSGVGAPVQRVFKRSVHRNSYNSESSDNSEQVASSSSEAAYSTPKSDEQYSWISEPTVDDEQSRSSFENRTSKRKRVHADVDDDDLPLNYSLPKADKFCKIDDEKKDTTLACVDKDYDSQHWKELLLNLVKNNSLSHDLFVYLKETLE